MEKGVQKLYTDFKTAVLFAMSFVLFAIVQYVWQIDNVPQVAKIVVAVAYGCLVMWLFGKQQLATFAGFCVLMLGCNYILQDETIHIFWKIIATIAVLLQLGTLGDTKSKISPAPNISQ